MVNIGTPFDPNAHEPRVAFGLIPAGWYGMQIIESELKPTSGGRGQMLVLTHQFVEAMHPGLKGRKVWDRLNLVNESAQAVAIANSTLSAICKAIGQVEHWEDSNTLHHRPLAVKIKIRPEHGEYEASNEITGYDSISRLQTGAPVDVTTMAAPPAAAPAQSQPATAPAAAPPPQGQPGQVAKPPWQK